MNTSDNTDITRRSALKAGSAAAVAAAIWAEPTIKGLARRPAYAAGGSTVETFNIDLSLGKGDSASVTGSNGTVISFSRSSNGKDVSSTSNPGGGYSGSVVLGGDGIGSFSLPGSASDQPSAGGTFVTVVGTATCNP